MKKNILTNTAVIIGAFMFAIPAFAATTASLTPATINVTPGQKFNVVITVNPCKIVDFEFDTFFSTIGKYYAN